MPIPRSSSNEITQQIKLDTLVGWVKERNPTPSKILLAGDLGVCFFITEVQERVLAIKLLNQLTWMRY